MLKKLIALMICLLMVISIPVTTLAKDNSVEILASSISKTSDGIQETGMYIYKGKIYTYKLDRGGDGSFTNVVTEEGSKKTETYTYDKKKKTILLDGKTVVCKINVKKEKVDTKSVNGIIGINSYSSMDYFVEYGDTNFYYVTVAAVASVLALSIPCPYTAALAIATAYIAGAHSPYTTFWIKSTWRYYNFVTPEGYYYPYKDYIECYNYYDAQHMNCYSIQQWVEWAPLP